jgi:Ca2+-binding RTX toxin-like protein
MSLFRSLFGLRDPFGTYDDAHEADALFGMQAAVRRRATDDGGGDEAPADEAPQTPAGGAGSAPTTSGGVLVDVTPDVTPTTSGNTGGTTSGHHGHGDPGTVLYVEGTDQGETLLGSYGRDEVHGRGGNDTIISASGDDKLFGEEGNDTLEGGSGNDVLDGGTGNDTLRGGAGADRLIGGEGMDNASYVLATSGVMVDLATGGITGEAAGDTYEGIENLFGTSYGDILNGDAQANVIHGGSGDDFVFGQAGDDRLFGDVGADTVRGGHGNDIINGGIGNDRLTGDDAGQFGNDTFVLRKGEGVDRITDFQSGHDKLDLRGFGITGFGSDGHLPNGATWGDLVWNADGGDKLVFDPYEHKLYQVTLAYSYDDYAWYVSSRSEIAVLEGVDHLSANDVILS